MVIRETFPQTTVIESPENGGFAKGNNLGLRWAKGRYCLLLNSDTIVLPGAIGTVLRYMEDRPHVGCTGCRLYYLDMSHQYSLARFPTLRNTFDEYLLKHNTALYPEAQYAHSMQVESIIGAFMMVSMIVVREVGLLDERYFMNCEDTDWCFRMWKRGVAVHYCADAAIIHIGSQSINKHRRKMLLELHKNRIKFFLFNYGYLKATGALIIILLAWLIEPLRFILRKIGIMNLMRRLLVKNQSGVVG